MKTKMLTEDNLIDFEGLVPDDVAENIGRDIYGGLAFCSDDKNADAAVVWEINHLEDEMKPVTTRFCWLHSDTETGVKELLSEYGTVVKDMLIRKSTLDLPKAQAEEFKGAFTEFDFDISETEGTDLIVSVGDLAKLEVVKKTKLPSNLYPVGNLISRTFRSGIMNCVFRTKRETLEDLTDLPMSWFDPELSCYVQTDDKITGFLLVHRLPSARLRVEFMSAVGPDARIDLMYMVRFSILNAMRLYPESTEVILPRRDVSAYKLTEYFFPGKKAVQNISGERKENGLGGSPF